MRTRPDDLDDASVSTAVSAGWVGAVSSVSYAPVGFGSHHWYAETDRGRLFVTVDDLSITSFDALSAALVTSCAARAGGLAFVVTPIPRSDGQILVRLTERYSLAVYPWIEARPHDFDTELTTDERASLLDELSRLHTLPAAVAAAARRDTLQVPRRDSLLALLDGNLPPGEGPYRETALRLLREHRDGIGRLLARVDELATTVADEHRFVLTHGEPHPGNALLGDDGWHLVDWESALLAPPERDLWDVVTDDAALIGRWEANTGLRVDPDALEYYRLAWAMAEVALSTTDLVQAQTDSADARVSLGALTEILAEQPWH